MLINRTSTCQVMTDLKQRYQKLYDDILTATGDKYQELYDSMVKIQNTFIDENGYLPDWMKNIPSEVNAPSGDGSRPPPVSPIPIPPGVVPEPEPETEPIPERPEVVEPSPGTGETPQDIGRTDDELRDDLSEEFRQLVVEAAPLSEASKVTAPGDEGAGIFEDTTRAEMRQRFDDIIERLKTIKILWEVEYELGDMPGYFLVLPVWYEYNECLAKFPERKEVLVDLMNQAISNIDMVVKAIGTLVIPRDNPQGLLSDYQDAVKDIRVIKEKYFELVDCAYTDSPKQIRKDLKREPPFDIKTKQDYPLPPFSFGGGGGEGPRDFNPIDRPPKDDTQKPSESIWEFIPQEVMYAGGGILGGIIFLAMNGGKKESLATRIQEASESIAWSSIYVAGGITVVIAGKSFFVCLDEVGGDFFKALGCTIAKVVEVVVEGVIDIIDTLTTMLLNNLGEFMERLVPLLSDMLVKMMKSLGKAVGQLGSDLTGGILPGGDDGGVLGSITGGIGDVFGF